jgi:hypothetical protein
MDDTLTGINLTAVTRRRTRALDRVGRSAVGDKSIRLIEIEILIYGVEIASTAP